jgi:flagellar motility protein MotE (MotC chaperone)
MDKVSTTYQKMKPKSAANILSALEPKEALKIIVNIQSKTLAKIFSKMTPQKASVLTTLLTKENITE